MFQHGLISKGIIVIIKAIKKPVTIEAIKLEPNERSIRECLGFMGVPVSSKLGCIHPDRFTDYCNAVIGAGMPIKTLESNGETQVASIGDYIIKGVQGEFYPCKPDIFKATYDFKEEK
ncbi:conserved hypothetical protein [Vibrio phage 416E50-1]|nr:conserved hypothetical protein [Vibrio phage 416E50-1]